MSARFEELAWHQTRMGEISLRRRIEPSLQVEVYEVKLDDEYLMSSLFTVAEIELARLALARLSGSDLDVVVGGLGLGYTAHAVLADPRVCSLHVVEALGEVIEWHQRGLLPLSEQLMADPRSKMVHGDFFAIVGGLSAPGSGLPSRCHALVIDIDHSPSHVLAPTHAAFYTRAGLGRAMELLHPGGVFALWSDDPPDDEFIAALASVFEEPEARVIRFPNALTHGESANTVYLATKRST